ncbi:hypothetical protein K474DRAFT_397168 [Panus rudis PR-1116 ss-1]|nr:hypothetical protein K474DRAFT_397168 [Panus rudis PR-1116 ss-1]
MSERYMYMTESYEAAMRSPIFSWTFQILEGVVNIFTVDAFLLEYHCSRCAAVRSREHCRE